jgi:hypothetical protein
MKKVALLLVCLSFFACSAITGKLSGTYYADDASLIDSISFSPNGTCRTVSSLFDINITQAFQYKVSGNSISVGPSGEMYPMFEIVDSNTIEGISTGFFGIYRKR